MSSGLEKRRLSIHPRGLVERADALTAVFETDRTNVLISALRELLRDAANSEEE